MVQHEIIPLSRDCEATLVPYGTKVILRAGDRVLLAQTLGGSYTVETERGDLARIAGKDADALGLEVAAAPVAAATPAAGRPVDEKLVWEQLKEIYDPEIPVNIVDLGLVYECHVTPLPQGGARVDVAMTMTAPGCGMGDVLKAEAQERLLTVPNVAEANVEVVWDPPWNPDRMSEEAKLALGL